MKCPHCGKETKGEKACENCGKALMPGGGMEVRYKDFKVTELLDIKMPGQAASPQADREAARESPLAGESAVEREALPVGKPARSKGSRLALAAVIVFLAATAGFILLKLLMKF